MNVVGGPESCGPQDDDHDLDIIMPGLIEEVLDDDGGAQELRNTEGTLFGKREIRQVQAHIASTTRPTWHTGPPLNFGSPAHGKLKADQW